MKAARAVSGGSPGVAPVGIAAELVRWQRVHGRHDLPWQGQRQGGSHGDPYRVWLSEVMLQQTQVATVIPYFQAFIRAFPTVADLAAAPLERVMSLWSGLGYYSRARNLHAAARCVMDRHNGAFPGDAAALAELPGVGQSTAAAIAVFGFGERAAILDGNVKRVFSRVFGIAGQPGEAAVVRRLWVHAQAELPPPGTPADVLRSYTQGLMDLGATLCTRTRPDCPRCPLRSRCVAHRDDAVARFPAPRPRRLVPIRAVEMLLLVSGATVLIEQRPPAGVWGSLWSLPELAADAGVDAVATQSISAAVRSATGLGLPATAVAEFARFEHALTHFRMHARVWRADLDAAGATAVLRQLPATRWLALADAAAAPLPRPVKSLLLELSSLL